MENGVGFFQVFFVSSISCMFVLLMFLSCVSVCRNVFSCVMFLNRVISSVLYCPVVLCVVVMLLWYLFIILSMLSVVCSSIIVSMWYPSCLLFSFRWNPCIIPVFCSFCILFVIVPTERFSSFAICLQGFLAFVCSFFIICWSVLSGWFVLFFFSFFVLSFIFLFLFY